MSASSNPSAAAASQRQSPDIQQLVGLLGNLMPLLLRFQSQVLEPEFPIGSGSGVVPDPALDHQAAVNLVANVTSDSLRTLSAYLEANAGQYAGLESIVPIVTQAAHRFAARDYAQAFDLIWLAYRAIETIRAADPRIPPLRASDPTPPDETPSIH